MAAKVRLGKWPEAVVIVDEYEAILAETRFQLLELTAAHALRAGRMPGLHRDPFDRLLAASSLDPDVPILSVDITMDTFGVRRIW